MEDAVLHVAWKPRGYGSATVRLQMALDRMPGCSGLLQDHRAPAPSPNSTPGAAVVPVEQP